MTTANVVSPPITRNIERVVCGKQVVQMHIHSSYLHRMTALYAIQVLTESLDVDMLGKVRGATEHMP